MLRNNEKTFMNRNFLLTVTLSLLSYFKEMTGDYETSLSLKCQSLHSQQKQQQRFITSAKREVKDSRRSGMYQSYHFLTRLGMQSL